MKSMLLSRQSGNFVDNDNTTCQRAVLSHRKDGTFIVGWKTVRKKINNNRFSGYRVMESKKLKRAKRVKIPEAKVRDVLFYRY